MERTVRDLRVAEDRLDAFDPKERMEALRATARGISGMHPPVPERLVNMHVHSFLSFNALGYSPSHIAIAAREARLYAVGLCDFDVLDGLEEFLEAGDALQLRATVNVETRVFFGEYAKVEISSPGEPGVTYIMGAGFVRRPEENTPEALALAGLREKAAARNVALVERIRARLPELPVDYAKDVLPLTPAGNATERHIVRACLAAAQKVFPDGEAACRFWGKTLEAAPDDIRRLRADEAAFEEKVRARLVKKGGLGFRQPAPDAFPTIDEFIAWVRACKAVPMATWLDGTSDGEKDGRAMLECLRGKGVAALNIIPDRNWNVAEPAARARKQRNLAQILELAQSWDMPVNIGTELNKAGQPFADDLGVEALAPHAALFMRGAGILVGHGLLSRFAAYPYTGEAAAAEFGSDTKRKNAFFEDVGKLPPLSQSAAARLRAMGDEKALACIRDSQGRGRWHGIR